MKIKRIISLLLAIVIMLSVAFLETSAAEKMPDLLIGDADGDGIVSIMDSTSIALHLAKIKQLDEVHIQTAKTYFETEVLSIIDATVIQQKVADIDNKDTGEVGKPAFLYINGEYVLALKEYQRYLDKILSLNEVSGVAYVTRNGRVLCQSAIGMQNTEKGIEMSLDTLFPVGSVSKQFCATAVLMLQDQGKLSVHDTIDKYFPDYKYASEITIHHLLCMRSGILDFLNDNPENYKLFVHDTAKENEQEVLDWIYSQELYDEPDECWAYSNSNYLLLARIVEQISGMEYTDFIQKYILDELSMTNTGFFDEIAYTEKTAERIVPDGIEALPWPVGSTKGAGDIVSNAYDMDKWLTAMADGVLLSEESYKMMTTNYSGGNNYGYGIYVESKNRYWHGGAIDTYETAVLSYSNNNLNVFVVTNDVYKQMEISVPRINLAKQIATKIGK